MMDEAMLMLTQMREQGVNPDVFTYSSVIAALCRMGRLADAMDKFSQMISIGVQPDTIVYQILIQGYCTHGDLGKTKELVYEMMNKGIPFPNIVFFSSVINGLCKEGRVLVFWMHTISSTWLWT
jgi:pentatricopeptide repeat protein